MYYLHVLIDESPCTPTSRCFFGFADQQRKIDRTASLRTLKNLDRLIVEGQGFEMVLLIRLAPLPTGPSQYFLGTTSVNICTRQWAF